MDEVRRLYYKSPPCWISCFARFEGPECDTCCLVSLGRLTQTVNLELPDLDVLSGHFV